MGKFLRISSALVNIHQILMSIFKREFNCSSTFALFFIVMTHNSSVNCKVINFLISIKGSYQYPTSEIVDVF